MGPGLSWDWGRRGRGLGGEHEGRHDLASEARISLFAHDASLCISFIRADCATSFGRFISGC